MKPSHKLTSILIGILASFGMPAQAQIENASNVIAINQTGEQRMNQTELEARGKKLREMLEPYVVRAYGKENWKFNVTLEKEAYDYFPVGLSFEDAIVILRAAGFDVLDRRLVFRTNADGTPIESLRYDLSSHILFPYRYIYRLIIGITLVPDFPRFDDVRVKSGRISIGIN